MGGPPAAVVGVDFEDWHQIVQRRLGYERWDRPRESFERQLQGVLSVFDEIGARVTFFLVGMTARHYPRLVEDAVARGHEIACHGYSHVPAWTQTPEEFRDDLLRSLDAIERLSGSRPVGYRAPIFSLDRRTPWAWEIIAEAGLLYDASLHDTPRNPMRLGNIPDTPFRIGLPSGRSLVEFPITVRRLWGRPIPVGGGTYWRVVPLRLIARGLRDHAASGGLPTLYFHPYEFEPERMSLEFDPTSAARRAQARYQVLRVNLGRTRVPERIRTIAQHFRFVSHGQACEELFEHTRLRTAPLPEEGCFV
jgi:polysaccharide deacetylase family protein (PEP-CTERM system associated)